MATIEEHKIMNELEIKWELDNLRQVVQQQDCMLKEQQAEIVKLREENLKMIRFLMIHDYNLEEVFKNELRTAFEIFEEEKDNLQF